MREEYVKTKNNLVSQLKKESNYVYTFVTYIWCLIAAALVSNVALFVYMLISKNNFAFIMMLIGNIIYFIIFIILMFLDNRANQAYSNLRRGVADIENLLNKKQEIVEPYIELYNKHKDYFDIYIKYIENCRK